MIIKYVLSHVSFHIVLNLSCQQWVIEGYQSGPDRYL